MIDEESYSGAIGRESIQQINHTPVGRVSTLNNRLNKSNNVGIVATAEGNPNNFETATTGKVVSRLDLASLLNNKNREGDNTLKKKPNNHRAMTPKQIINTTLLSSSISSKQSQ